MQSMESVLESVDFAPAKPKKYAFKAINNIWQFYGQVEKELLQRPDWEKVNDDAQRFDFLIADRGHVKFSTLHSGQLVNYYRGHREITDKAAMAVNIRAYCVEQKIDHTSFIPLTFILYPQAKDPNAWLDDYMKQVSVSDDADKKADTPSTSAPYAAPSVASSIRDASSSSPPPAPPSGYSANGGKPLPRKPSALRLARVGSFTTLLKRDDEREAFRKVYDEMKSKSTVWIAKSTQGAKGSNILVSRDFDALVAHVDADFSGLRTQSWVIQQYLERPYLIHGRKFDIRSWVLVDSQFRIYHYRLGVCRLSSEPFRLAELENRFVHLTNHCIQTEHPNYGDVVTGNEMFFDEFDEYLKKSESGKTVAGDLMPQLNKIIVQTFLSIKDRMQVQDNYLSLQIFGFDFMLDADFKAVLIETNATPASAEKLLVKMVQDLIKVCIDPVFPPQGPTISEDNWFDCIYSPDSARN